MTHRNERARSDRIGAHGGTDARTASRVPRPLGHHTPVLTGAHYRHVILPDRPPEVRAEADGSAVTVSFVAGGRPCRAYLPSVTVREARVRAMKAYRLIRAACERERMAEAVLRGDPPTAADA